MKYEIEGDYIPFHDGYGIVGYIYVCPKCNTHNPFQNCDEGCKKCGFKEPYVDADDWYEYNMGLPDDEKAWNRKTTSVRK
jgi:hypothetical protein